ncbi:peptidoglycan-associated lipoprotein Pal [Halodesulfovibrio sp.]|jgi:peptidoglycan-associated lipoprotein|uniref:peptidoglycan-associated lipoprotein Pal n=1 Tax=Halodesulfovibrio sp. TaxID=1912772 RepID=UPI0025EBD22D|nr:peptidoglycan-associated lipoprotein Pal [Halodesulfovibrio sp.]MCT4535778.1 peptidoglycan-associated lipoprotein Pal [Halodesulfovibrio sp.]MCT4627635.1 peptidoglycan-associated lipoprotein Pal [Halodesulfovibrio sp.]
MIKRFGFALLLIMVMSMSFGCAKKQVAVTPEKSSGSEAAVVEVSDSDNGSVVIAENATASEAQLAEEIAAAAATLADTPILFDFDKFDIKPMYRDVLKQNAELLKKYPTMRMLIAGHTDPRGTSEYNLALGERRARAVQDYLIVLGVSATQLEIVSYGEERPAAQGANEAAWAQDRRAEFALIQ